MPRVTMVVSTCKNVLFKFDRCTFLYTHEKIKVKHICAYIEWRRGIPIYNSQGAKLMLAKNKSDMVFALKSLFSTRRNFARVA